jgi:hypothetical protein
VHADVHCLGVVGALRHILVDDLETDAFGSHEMSDSKKSGSPGGYAAHWRVHADVTLLGVVGVLWHVLVDHMETDAFGSHEMSDSKESRSAGGQAALRDMQVIHCLGRSESCGTYWLMT